MSNLTVSRQPPSYRRRPQLLDPSRCSKDVGTNGHSGNADPQEVVQVYDPDRTPILHHEHGGD